MNRSRAKHEDPRAPHGTSAKTVEWIDRIINDVENEALQAEIRQEVKAFMAAYPLYAEESVLVG